MAVSAFFDLMAFVLIVILGALGAKSGLIRGVFRFLGLLGGFLIAFTYFRDIEPLFGWLSRNRQVVSVGAFLITFFAAFFAFVSIGMLLRKALEMGDLGWIDRTCGFILGAMKAAVILWAVCLSVASVPQTGEIQDMFGKTVDGGDLHKSKFHDSKQESGFQGKFSKSVTYKAYRALPKSLRLDGMEKTRKAIQGKKRAKSEGDESVIDNILNANKRYDGVIENPEKKK